jgi:hypothetical protein
MKNGEKRLSKHEPRLGRGTRRYRSTLIGYSGFAQSNLVHVLWIDANGNETWITTVFQQ